MGLSEVAQLVGVSGQNMRKLMLAQSYTFPVPVHEGKAALWHLGDLLAWLRDEARYAIAGDLFEVGPPGR